MLVVQALKSLGTAILAILTLGATSAKRGTRPGRMGQALSIFTFIVIGAAILAIAWWYVMAIRDSFFTDKRAYVLGEVEVVGKSDVAEIYKKVLPRLIVAKLTTLRNETNDAVLSLKEARDRRAGEQRLQTQELVTQRDLPQPFSQPLEIELKIADVDVGPILSFLTARALYKEILEVTASLTADGLNANVYGHLPGSEGYSFTERTKNSPDDIADSVAAAIIAEAVKREEPALAALGAEAYGTVLSVLSDYAKHRKIAPMLADGGQAELENFNDRLRETAFRFSRWRDLQWLAAEIAEEARKWEDSYAYYSNLAAITPKGHADRMVIDQKLGIVETERNRILAAQAVAKRRGVDPESILEKQVSDGRSAASASVSLQLSNPILRLLGLTAAIDVGGQKIGVVGAPWDESLANIVSETLYEIDDKGNDSSIRDYITMLVQATRIVASNATFVFAPIPAKTTMETGLLEALDTLSERSDVDVILYAFGGPSPDQAINSVVRDISASTAVVLPAGNLAGNDSIYSDVVDLAFVAGAVDQTGGRAYFTSETKGMVWAPGVDVPVISPRSGSTERRSGTAFSSAIAAGAVAILRNRFPNAATAMLLSALRDTAKPAEGRKSPPIINIPAALENLEKSADKQKAG